MRIIGGKYRSRVLNEFKGMEIRPTSDRVKESLFNILSLKINGARVLDLFCGSGSLGIECLSRGAKEVLFNDCAKESIAVLNKNLKMLNLLSPVTQSDYMSCLKSQTKPFDLIFIDPPYRMDYGVPSLNAIAQWKLLSEKGIAIYERDCPFEGSIYGLEKYDERKYGKTYLTFFRKTEE